MPPWLDWLDWLKWDCIGASALGKILGVWFGFCIRLSEDCFAGRLRLLKVALAQPTSSVFSSVSSDSDKFLVSGKTHQNCSFHSPDGCSMDCHHLEAGVVSRGYRGRPTPQRGPSPYKCGLANLIVVDLVFKTHG